MNLENGDYVAGKSIKFSIIVPVFNVASKLSRCIKSVLKQSFVNFELILVDDGSTDESPSICDSFSGFDERVFVIHKNNGGLTSARKAGSLSSRGEYIICLDGDDFLCKDYLENANEIIQKTKTSMIVFDYYEKKGKEEVLRRNNCKEGYYCEEDIKKILSSFIFDNNEKWPNEGCLSYSIWSKIVKRSLYIGCQNSIQDNVSLGEDLLLSLKILKNCKNLYVTRTAGYYYQISPSSMSHRFDIKSFEKIEILVSALSLELKDDNRVSAFAISSLMNQISSLAKNTSFFDFLGFIAKTKRQCPLLWSFSRLAKINHIDFFKKIEIVFIKMNLFPFLYFFLHNRKNQ